jgi:O-6-methylguanine DNA methyltransferase
MNKFYAFTFPTPIGLMMAVADNDFLFELEFHESELTLNETPILEKKWKATFTLEPNVIIKKVMKQLEEYFNGTRITFDIPLRPKGTSFQQEVWTAIQQITFGQTRTYMMQAKAMNNPLGIRAIAKANGANTIAIIIPCHRIIGSNGKLVGYAWGLHRKQFLLEHEALHNPQGSQQKLF